MKKEFQYSHRPSDIFPAGVSELTMTYKRTYDKRVEFFASNQIFQWLHSIYSAVWMYQEEFYVLMLDRTNKLFAYKRISAGSSIGTVCDPQMVFQLAIMCHCKNIVLVHNHPSGSSKPSQQDIDLTRKIKQGGKLLEVEVADHIIYAGDNYYSFSDEGML